MNNNLDDFFRKKLDEDLSSDGWDEPSKTVWETAQSGFPTYPTKRKINGLLILLMLLALGLTAAGGYIFHVKKGEKKLNEEIVLLKNDLKQQKTAFAALATNYSTLQKQHTIDSTSTLFKK